MKVLCGGFPVSKKHKWILSFFLTAACALGFSYYHTSHRNTLFILMFELIILDVCTSNNNRLSSFNEGSYHFFLSTILQTKSLDNCLAANNATWPTFTKSGMSGQGSRSDTCHQGDIWSSHEENNERVEQFSARAVPFNQSPLASSFHPGGRTSAVC